ncbi:cuticle protein CP1876 [Procambarus clarkii]|uniref:cuticle protein CP1876 n=1 Tax=Procambarus clarkii TaxID=6728 RepID=UPI003742A6D4
MILTPRRSQATPHDIMRFLVIASVVFGLAHGQGFPRDTPEVQAARDAFVREYNRLAELAALAPDIHIYEQRPLTQVPAHLQHLSQQPRPAAPIPPAFNAYSFSASLGGSQQFVPGPNTFPSSPGHQAGHLAGHQAGHQAPVHRPAPVHRFSASPDQPAPWTGPLADDVPAGVSGRTQDTPNVAAAKAAHFRAHATALGIRV